MDDPVVINANEAARETRGTYSLFAKVACISNHIALLNTDENTMSVMTKANKEDKDSYLFLSNICFIVCSMVGG